MNNESTAKELALRDARITQASVMDEKSILLVFSNGSSALLPSEAVKELVLSSGAQVLPLDEAPE